MALVEDRSRNWTIAVASAYAGEGPMAARLERGGEVLTRMVEEESEWMLLSNEMWSYSVRDPRRRARLADGYEECREIIASVVSDVEREYGARMPLPSQQVAMLTVALTDGFILQRLADPGRLPGRMLADGLNLLFSALLSLSTPDGPRRASSQPGGDP